MEVVGCVGVWRCVVVHGVGCGGGASLWSRATELNLLENNYIRMKVKFDRLVQQCLIKLLKVHTIICRLWFPKRIKKMNKRHVIYSATPDNNQPGDTYHSVINVIKQSCIHVA